MEDKQSAFAIIKPKIKLAVPILLVVIFQSAFNSFSPILSTLKIRFPDIPITIIQTVITLPSLVSTGVAITVGLLASYIYKKRLVQVALIAMALGGLVPILFHTSIYSVLISSALIGGGQGALISVSSALISTTFDGNERGVVFGLKEVASNIGITGLTILVGFLARTAWYHAYLGYFLTIPVLILVTLFLPLGEKEQKLVGKNVGLKGIKNIVNPGVIYMFCLVFLCGGTMFGFYTNFSMSCAEKGIIDTAVVAGITSVAGLASLIVAAVYYLILRIFRKYALCFAFLILVVAFIILSFGKTVTALTIGCVFFGIGAGLQEAGTLYFVSETASKENVTLVMAFTIAIIGIGIVASPFFIRAVNQGIFGSTTCTTALLASALVYGILCIIEYTREKILNKNSLIGIPQKK